jgi:NADH-quinone oxidoreductase subunit C
MTSTDITYESIAEQLAEQFPNQILGSELSFGILALTVERVAIVPIITWLKEDPTLRFIFLTDLCGIHFPEQKGQELGVVYHLHSLENNIRLRLKIFFPANDPVVDTLTPVFDGANWMERETFDFFGIQFKGHPDMRRILNMDEMDYHPLLKQYPLEDGTRTDKDDKFFGR